MIVAKVKTHKRAIKNKVAVVKTHVRKSKSSVVAAQPGAGAEMKTKRHAKGSPGAIAHMAKIRGMRKPKV